MIWIVGLGPGGEGALSVAARDCLLSGLPVLLRTEKHPTTAFLQRAGISFQTCDDLYDSAKDFEDLYGAIVERVLDMARDCDMIYAVPGDPVVGEETVRRLVALAQEGGAAVRIVHSISFIEPVLSACGVSLGDGLLLVDAQSAERRTLPLDVPIVLYQAYDREVASRVKLALLRDRPAELEVAVVRRAGCDAPPEVDRIPLYRLDRVHMDHLTAVYVPPVPADRRKPSFADLVEVMRRLRAPDGCPWDRAQTHETLRKWFIEETYEAVEAIDRADMEGLCEELGDVLLQIVFHAQMASEAGVFDIDDVIRTIVEKLVRRHPHVFGEGRAETAEVVEQNWEAIKNAEKNERTSVLDGVPSSLPALHRAAELSRRAAAVGFDWKRVEDVLAKVEEELEEVRRCLQDNDPACMRHEIGDLLFAVANLARWTNVEAEEALRQMLGRFVSRFQRIEAAARASGRELSSLTLDEMEAIWDQAKGESDTSASGHKCQQ